MNMVVRLQSVLFIACILLFSISFISCEENEAPKAKISFSEVDGTIKLSAAGSSDPNDDPLTYLWECSNSVVDIQKANSQEASILPNFDEGKRFLVSLIVDDGELTNEISDSVRIHPSEYSDWGLGRLFNDAASNNRAYDWYLDQKNTGKYNFENCGPTATTMALKWAKEGFDKTPEDARATYRPDGGWWYTSDIISYLNLYSVSNKTIPYNTGSLKNELKAGNIIILCLDMYYITYNSSLTQHIHKYYRTANPEWGHFIVLKGYVEQAGQTYFEVYDPNSWGAEYSDATPKGLDRFYLGSDLANSAKIWWNNAIVVSKAGMKSTGGLDVSKIEHKWGGSCCP